MTRAPRISAYYTKPHSTYCVGSSKWQVSLISTHYAKPYSTINLLRWLQQRIRHAPRISTNSNSTEPWLKNTSSTLTILRWLLPSQLFEKGQRASGIFPGILCVAVGCSELQWVAVGGSGYQGVASGICSGIFCVAVCWNVLQCVTTCCIVLQCVAVCCVWKMFWNINPVQGSFAEQVLKHAHTHTHTGANAVRNFWRKVKVRLEYGVCLYIVLQKCLYFNHSYLRTHVYTHCRCSKICAHIFYVYTAYYVWSVISSFPNLNWRSNSLLLFYHVLLKRDQGDCHWSLRLFDFPNAISCTYSYTRVYVYNHSYLHTHVYTHCRCTRICVHIFYVYTYSYTRV